MDTLSAYYVAHTVFATEEVHARQLQIVQSLDYNIVCVCVGVL